MTRIVWRGSRLSNHGWGLTRVSGTRVDRQDLHDPPPPSLTLDLHPQCRPGGNGDVTRLLQHRDVKEGIAQAPFEFNKAELLVELEPAHAAICDQGAHFFPASRSIDKPRGAGVRSLSWLCAAEASLAPHRGRERWDGLVHRASRSRLRGTSALPHPRAGPRGGSTPPQAAARR